MEKHKTAETEIESVKALHSAAIEMARKDKADFDKMLSDLEAEGRRRMEDHVAEQVSGHEWNDLSVCAAHLLDSAFRHNFRSSWRMQSRPRTAP